MNQESTLRLQEFTHKYQFLSRLENLKLNFGPIEADQVHPFEQIFMHNIFLNLSEWNNFFNYRFFIIGALAPHDFEIDKDCVIFYLSNEDHQVPEELLKAKAIFTPYCPTGSDKPDNVHPIPLGYNGSLLDLEMKPILERKQDVFFSGNLHKKRLPFFLGYQWHKSLQRADSLLGTKKDRNEYIVFTRKFGSGLNPEQYSNMLMDSKIAIVPSGYISKVTFRFFEAAKYGCIVLTPRIYDYWYYDGFPGLYIDNWMNFHSILNKTLKDPAKLEQMHHDMMEYYKEKCTEEAVSKYVIQQIEG